MPDLLKGLDRFAPPTLCVGESGVINAGNSFSRSTSSR